MGKTETIYFSDLTPEEKAEALQKLSSKARIPDLK
jgi:hypothetical protein